MKKYHYVYKITNLKPTDERRYYIGVRSSKVKPEEDTKYQSSSKYLKEALKEIGHDNFKKEIISTWDTRKEANQEEIRLHKLYDVAKNPKYYNKARATSTKFCTEGLKVVKNVENGNLLVPISYNGDEFESFNKGQILVKESSTNKYKKITNAEYFANKNDFIIPGTKEICIYDATGNLKFTTYGNFEEVCILNNIPFGELKKSYQNGGILLYSNPVNSNKMINENNKKFIGWYAIEKNENHNHCEHVNDFLSSTMINIIYKNKIKSVSIYEYNHKYKDCGIISKSSKVIKIYDDNDTHKYTFINGFRKNCENFGLPFRALANSYRLGGKKLYLDYSKREITKLIKNNFIKYKGWYAKEEEI